MKLGYNIVYVSDAAASLAFFERATADVAAACQQAVKAGATLVAPPVTKPWDQGVAYVRCPHGTLVELCTEIAG